MNLQELERKWNRFGKTDPLWAILTAPGTKGNKWRTEEFFQTGVTEVSELMDYIQAVGISIPRARALDFGCGVGRLSQALALHFEQVYGVDIAESMIALANQYNQHGDRCRYVLNTRDDLGAFSDGYFDLIYSNITLQHMEPRYAMGYIREFLRLLDTRGVLVFQMPGEPNPDWVAPDDSRLRKLVRRAVPAAVLDLYRKARYGATPTMDMYYIRREEMARFLESHGGKIRDIQESRHYSVDYRYCVAKMG
jgi:2-polyprenyl-3-methyl-5-hydroxy-6-metoxy-1,4-benzoquinol methylase